MSNGEPITYRQPQATHHTTGGGMTAQNDLFGTLGPHALGYNDFVRRLDGYGGPRVGLIVRQERYAPHVRVLFGTEMETRSADILVKVDREIVYVITMEGGSEFPSLAWTRAMGQAAILFEEACARPQREHLRLWRVEVPRYDLDDTLAGLDADDETSKWLRRRRPAAEHAALIRERLYAPARARTDLVAHA